MGVLNSIRRLLAGSGTKTLPVSLDPGETEQARWVASNRPGTVTSVGGDLVLTNRRLVFTPLGTADIINVMTWGLTQAGAPDAVSQVPSQLGRLVGAEQIPGVSVVAPGANGSFATPPTLRVTTYAGASIELGILASRRSMNPDPANVRARDSAVETIRRLLASTSS